MLYKFAERDWELFCIKPRNASFYDFSYNIKIFKIDLSFF
jgi:hypothetical protein